MVTVDWQAAGRGAADGCIPRACGGAVVALAAAWASIGCAPAPVETARAEALVVQVFPFVVEGQEERPQFLGQAFAQSLAGALAQADDSRLTVRVAPMSEAAGLPPEAAAATRFVRGTLRRDERTVQAHVQLRDPDGDSLRWEARLSSNDGTLSWLAASLARQAARALEVSYPDLYGSIDDLTAGPEMEASQQWTDDRDWRRYGVDERMQHTAALVARYGSEPSAHVLDAWALMLAWDADPSNEAFLLRLRERLNELQRIDPRSPYDDLMRAYIYRSSGEPNRSRDLCSQVSGRTDLSNALRAWALRQRSLAHLQAGNATAARHDAERAVDLDPANALSLIALSKSLETLGEFDAAIAISRQALTLEPFQWRHHQRLGLVYGRAGDHAAAALAMDRACAMSENQEACANVAVARQRAGRRDEARAAAEYAESLPGTAFGLYNLACYRALAGQKPAAIVGLGRAIDLGFADLLIESDRDLDALRSDPAFAGILHAVRERLNERRKTSGAVFPWQS